LVNQGVADILVTVSAKTRQNAICEGVEADRIITIRNGIHPIPLDDVNRSDMRRQLDLEEGDVFLLSVGRLVYQKAHEILVRAMPLILSHNPRVKVGICGEGGLRPQLEASISELDLTGSVRLYGNLHSVAGYLSAADIFVLPSRWEGLPIALLEAMSAGLPVVATRVEGVEEVVVEGTHGLLVPVGDSQALANAILQLLQDPQLARRMGASAREHILADYTEDRMCEQYLKLMLKQLNRKAEGSEAK
jgi:glycosyltransferase involved in cell wall biosynthesis